MPISTATTATIFTEVGVTNGLQQDVLRFYPGQRWACWVYRDSIVTVLSDGTMCRGRPPADEGFLESARALGYGDDIYWHIVEHDLAHNWLAYQLTGGHSVSLWGQCHNRNAWKGKPPADVEREEHAVGALQAAMNGNAWGFRELLDHTTKGNVGPLVGKAQYLFRSPCPMTTEWALNADSIHRVIMEQRMYPGEDSKGRIVPKEIP